MPSPLPRIAGTSLHRQLFLVLRDQIVSGVLPDGTRNDLSADNVFTVLINTSRREAVATTEPTTPTATEAPKS